MEKKNVIKESANEVVTVLFAEASTKYVGRVNIQTDALMLKLNEHGEEEETDTFSQESFALTRQLRSCSRDFLKWSLKAGRDLAPNEIGMLLFGAKLTISRTLKHEGEKRDFSDEPYSRDTYATRILAVEINKDEALLDELAESIKESKLAAAAATANPFGF